MDSCQLIRKETKMDIVHFNQRQLAARWDISEAMRASPSGMLDTKALKSERMPTRISHGISPCDQASAKRWTKTTLLMP